MLYVGTIPPTVGAFLAAIRLALLAEGWTSKGIPSTNKEIFGSIGTSGTDDVLIEVGDATAGSVSFRSCTAYNDGTKVLTNPTTLRYIQLSTTYTQPYWFIITLDRFVAVVKNFATAPYGATYCGLLNRYNPFNVYCVLVTGASTPTGSPIGFANGNTLTGGLGQLLKDHGGIYNRSMDACALNNCFGAAQLPNPVDGKLIISPIVVGKSISELHGELIDCYSCACSATSSEDKLLKGAEEYLVFVISTTLFAVRTV
jgi:hypothetical protein